ncbi:SCO1860 family LAETG-anchored protein [Streptomyces winkii]|uniref:SCO1860 family LAETG-anchored protein n=1 Tax=Streptomyces winkii TaxID=3051178 RepID=UPI0028D31FDF|nr:SCO1860 family LAETG-anchored protein [Streptomyces sp. DSM 40971]
MGAATVMVGGTLATVPAYAASADGHSGSTGKATAAAARADLNVSVANAAKVPVRASLNAVSAPSDAEKTLLTADVKGANKGQPVTLVQADVARSGAKADEQRSIGKVRLAGVRAFAPGLPGKPLLSADLLTANASCRAGEKPTAKSQLEKVTVLGKPVTLDAGGSKKVELPGLGSVDVSLEQEKTTGSTGAATALKLSYEVNPAKLNVVKAAGEIVLSEATCESPKGGGAGDNEPAPQTGGSSGDDGGGLAETGGNAATPIIAGVGAVLVLGGGTMYLIRRRSAQRG